MAEIHPFRGVLYNPLKISDLAKAICPPYDIISPAEQDELYARDTHNFVRIEYNRETAQDNDRDNRYIRAAGYITGWLKEQVLVADAGPAFYLHTQSFNWQGKSYRRRNLTACVRLEEWESKIIRPHENIIPKAKSDRMNMLEACQANTSVVLAMFQDPGEIIATCLSKAEKIPPRFDFTDFNGERQQLWTLTDPVAIRVIQEAMAGQPLYIADGHHRYDSALTYRKKRVGLTASPGGEEGYNFVMMSLIDFADPGMVILPTHRLVRGVPSSLLKDLKPRLQTFFDIVELPNSKNGWQEVDEHLNATWTGSQSSRLLVYGLTGDGLAVLSLRDEREAERWMPAARSDRYKKLDVSLVDHVILEGQLGYNHEAENLTLAYTRDRAEAVQKVRSGEYQLAFILNPVSPDVIKGIADAGDRMPRKSTYFYPKSPAGLVFYKW
ncbi:MAG TPA: DUF1015 domain-containing protein [Dehalococcoidales bacterium]